VDHIRIGEEEEWVFILGKFSYSRMGLHFCHCFEYKRKKIYRENEKPITDKSVIEKSYILISSPQVG